MQKNRIIISLSLVVLVTVLCVSVANAANSESYRLFFPNIKLDTANYERIEEVDIKVVCGHIESVTKIPDDWNIEIDSAISGAEEFYASAGHGASRLGNLHRFNGAILITYIEKSCFDISATIVISGTNARRHIDLPRKALRLRP